MDTLLHGALFAPVPIAIFFVIFVTYVFKLRQIQRIVLDQQRQLDDLKRELEEVKRKE